MPDKSAASNVSIFMNMQIVKRGWLSLLFVASVAYAAGIQAQETRDGEIRMNPNERSYLEMRRAAVHQFEKTDADSKAEKQALEALQTELRAAIGSVRMDGFSGQGERLAPCRSSFMSILGTLMVYSLVIRRLLSL